MSAPEDKLALVNFWTTRCRELLQGRGNLTEDDLGYLVERLDKLRDERFKSLVAEMIGWGTDERAELETFCAIALAVMSDASPSRLREAARRVELTYLMNNKKDERK